MDVSKYKALYLQETSAHLSGVEAGLLALEKGFAAKTVDDLFRHYHSIKGMSASMGYEPIKRLAHAQEELLDKIRSKKMELTPLITSTLFRCLDGLKSMVRKVEEDTALDTDIGSYITILKAAIEGRTPEKKEPQAETEAPGLTISHLMKVEGKVFDELLTTVGDLFNVLSSFKSISHKSRSVALKDGVYLFGKSVDSLYDRILAARMLPIQDLTEGLPRVIRDLCKASGKEVSLKMEGAEISLDRSILEGLGSPLVHIIRNCVDHGIEPPSERSGKGKPEAGTIMIKAYAKKGRVAIEIADDGRGIDAERLKEKALAKGFDRQKLLSMTDKEALRLICMPGLSTAEAVTETSGRGVGMDVVKDTVEGLGGTLDIDSTPGKGTKITLELPRTSSIIKALTVAAGDEVFLMPISKVEKVLEVQGPAPAIVSYGGEDIDVISLPKALSLDIEENTGSRIVIVTEKETKEDGEKRFIGIMADDFGDEVDAFIKPLIPPMSRLWGVAGITIMGDGRPVFLLDVQQIISKALAL